MVVQVDQAKKRVIELGNGVAEAADATVSSAAPLPGISSSPSTAEESVIPPPLLDNDSDDNDVAAIAALAALVDQAAKRFREKRNIVRDTAIERKRVLAANGAVPDNDDDEPSAHTVSSAVPPPSTAAIPSPPSLDLNVSSLHLSISTSYGIADNDDKNEDTADALLSPVKRLKSSSSSVPPPDSDDSADIYVADSPFIPQDIRFCRTNCCTKKDCCYSSTIGIATVKSSSASTSLLPSDDPLSLSSSSVSSTSASPSPPTGIAVTSSNSIISSTPPPPSPPTGIAVTSSNSIISSTPPPDYYISNETFLMSDSTKIIFLDSESESLGTGTENTINISNNIVRIGTLKAVTNYVEKCNDEDAGLVLLDYGRVRKYNIIDAGNMKLQVRKNQFEQLYLIVSVSMKTGDNRHLSHRCNSNNTIVGRRGDNNRVYI